MGQDRPARAAFGLRAPHADQPAHRPDPPTPNDQVGAQAASGSPAPRCIGRHQCRPPAGILGWVAAGSPCSSTSRAGLSLLPGSIRRGNRQGVGHEGGFRALRHLQRSRHPQNQDPSPRHKDLPQMNIDNELSDAMHNLASDSPAEAEVAATVRARINRRHTFRRTALATVAAVAAVAAIVTTASLLRSPAQPDQIQAASTPEILSSSAPVTTPPTTTGNPAVTGTSARCYTTADIGRTDNHLAISFDVPAGPVALEICQQQWEEGTLSSTAPFIADSPAASGQSAPNLVACVLPADISDEGTEEVAVFPGSDDTCAQLNLPRYTG